MAIKKKHSVIQSILFSTDKWSLARAKSWLHRHGFKYGKIDVTENNMRFRQVTPHKGKKYGTIKFGRGTGIKAVRIKNPKHRVSPEKQYMDFHGKNKAKITNKSVAY